MTVLYMFEFVLTSNLITSNACKSSLELWTTSQFLHTPLKLLRRGNKYGYPHAVILHLSHGFKLSFKKSWFLWGFQLFIWKIINIWLHICVKHRKLCYIYEIKAKMQKKRGNICHWKMYHLPNFHFYQCCEWYIFQWQMFSLFLLFLL